jgi:hypothetical protein
MRRIGVLKLSSSRATMLVTPAIGFALTYLAYKPGLITLDSDFQLVQARRFGFSDWHPIIMSLIWSGTNYLLAGPLGFFLLLLGMYWIGFFLISKHFYRRSRTGYVLALVLPFFPLLINFSGTLWKDVLVFDCFLLSLGLMLYLRGTNVSGLPILLSSTAVLLIALGVLARYNSQLAAIPLLTMLIWPSLGTHRVSMRLVTRRLLLSGALIATLFLSGSTVLNMLLRPEHTHPEGALLIFDLVGISHRVGHNLIPGEWTAEQTQSILTACYEPKGWDSIWASCEFVIKKLRSEGLWANLMRPWWKALSTYPTEYLLHRMAYLQSLFSTAIDAHLFVSDPSQEALQHSATAPLLFNIQSLVLTGKSVPLLRVAYSVGFWLIASVLALCASGYLFLRRPWSSYEAFLLSLSAVLYVAPLAFIGTAGDFRYAYWSICATGLALVFMLDDHASAEQLRYVRP